MASLKLNSILSIILSIIVLAIVIWNLVYIGGVRRQLAAGASNLNLSASAANIIFWVDIMLIVILAIFIIYNLVILFTTKEQRAVVTQTVATPLTSLSAQFPIRRSTVDVGASPTAVTTTTVTPPVTAVTPSVTAVNLTPVKAVNV